MKLAPLFTAVVSGMAAEATMAGTASASGQDDEQEFLHGYLKWTVRARLERRAAGGIGTGIPWE